MTDLKVTQDVPAFFTTVTINGRNAEMLFDTGGEKNSLLESSTRRLGLHVDSFAGRVINGLGVAGIPARHDRTMCGWATRAARI